jgi:flavin reductase (DIM6/NTAB) family NADH-FMN oxidoreductase RutF
MASGISGAQEKRPETSTCNTWRPFFGHNVPFVSSDFTGLPMHSRSPRATSPSFDATHFRKALSQFATGVTVITTRLADGTLLGLTASSFNSVSMTPPLVLWSLSENASSMPVFSGNSHYVINILGADQGALAEQFARKSADRFAGVEYTLSRTGQPVLNGVSAWFECHNRSRYPEGDHVIFVGEVEHCEVSPQAGLVFHDGRFIKTSA